MTSIYSLRSVFIIVVLFVLLSMAWSDQTMAGVLAFPQFKSKEEKQTLERQALQGSPEAADKIVSILGLSESSDGFYWASIAAENASKNGAYSVGVLLSNAGPEEARLYGTYIQDRKWYWLKKAANGGDTDAIFTLKETFHQAKKMNLEPETEIQQWVVSKKTLSKFKRSAMRGSPEAAFRLYQYYSSPTSKLAEGLFWATIAAQNGHPKASYVVGKLMLKNSESRNHERAQFWLLKAAAAGSKEANLLLEKEFPKR